MYNTQQSNPFSMGMSYIGNIIELLHLVSKLDGAYWQSAVTVRWLPGSGSGSEDPGVNSPASVTAGPRCWPLVIESLSCWHWVKSSMVWIIKNPGWWHSLPPSLLIMEIEMKSQLKISSTSVSWISKPQNLINSHLLWIPSRVKHSIHSAHNLVEEWLGWEWDDNGENLEHGKPNLVKQVASA